MPLEPWINDTPDDPLFNEVRDDDVAFQLLFKRYFAILCTYCQYQYSFDLDLAKEAVHSSFIKLWETRKSLSTELSVKAYLYRIVSNCCVDLIRHRNVKRKYERYIQQHFTEASFDHDLDVADVKILKEAIDKAVSGLPEKMRIIFQLSRYEGLKYAQIAKRLDLSTKTVETQMSRALLRLRIALHRFFTLAGLLILAAQNYFK